MENNESVNSIDFKSYIKIIFSLAIFIGAVFILFSLFKSGKWWGATAVILVSFLLLSVIWFGFYFTEQSSLLWTGLIGLSSFAAVFFESDGMNLELQEITTKSLTKFVEIKPMDCPSLDFKTFKMVEDGLRYCPMKSHIDLLNSTINLSKAVYFDKYTSALDVFFQGFKDINKADDPCVNSLKIGVLECKSLFWDFTDADKQMILGL